ncbi:hypothetical protein OEZ86_003702 [Tetradesmus obliquus]|nr:hypothetical protein OEZ86_003702 [Tetradesmus obliquus]
MQQEYSVAGRVLRLVAPLDVDAVMDMYIEAGIDGDPYCPTVPERFDVVLACDVLYEDTAVEPVAAVVGRLLKPGSGSSLLLADPPNRTAANRQRFVELLSGGLAGGINLRLEESGIYQCDVSQLDPEMKGGVTTQSVGVQFMAFRAAVGNDTIGIKFD